MRLLMWLFGCRHRNLAFPQTPVRNGFPVKSETYRTCNTCGREFLYDWERKKLGPEIKPMERQLRRVTTRHAANIARLSADSKFTPRFTLKPRLSGFPRSHRSLDYDATGVFAAIALTAALQRRDDLLHLLGDRYAKAVLPYRQVIRRIATEKHIRIVDAGLELSKKMDASGHDPNCAIAAMIDEMEQAR